MTTDNAERTETQTPSSNGNGHTPETPEAAKAAEESTSTTPTTTDQTAETTGQETTSAAEGGSEEPEFSADDLLNEIAGTPPSETQQERKLPGKSQEDIRREQDEYYSSMRNQILQQGDQEVQRLLREELNLSPQESQRVWEQLRPFLTMLDQANTNRRAQPLNAQLNALKERDESAFNVLAKNQYSSEDELIEGLVAAGRSAQEQDFQEQVKKGQYLTRKQATQAADKAYQKGRADGEKAAGRGESGNESGGSRPSRNGRLTKESAESLPVNELTRFVRR